jgi:hypothetical protein
MKQKIVAMIVIKLVHRAMDLFQTSVFPASYLTSIFTKILVLKMDNVLIKLINQKIPVKIVIQLVQFVKDPSSFTALSVNNLFFFITLLVMMCVLLRPIN